MFNIALEVNYHRSQTAGLPGVFSTAASRNHDLSLVDFTSEPENAPPMRLHARAPFDAQFLASSPVACA